MFEDGNNSHSKRMATYLEYHLQLLSMPWLNHQQGREWHISLEIRLPE